MRILIVGSGGREHAIGWKVKQSQNAGQMFFAPGNGGTAELGTNIDIGANEIEKLADYVVEHQIDLTIVGPEAPLGLGIADVFRKRGLKIFGPDKNGAQLETSKAFAKSFMEKYGIPTARYEVYTDVRLAARALENWEYPLVIKADGLAAGKGVIICETKDSALEAINQIMHKKAFGSSGDTIIIEEFLEGREVSLLCFTDGITIVPMESAADYKRALDNDEGLNTGGMGSISPAPYYKDEMGADIAKKTLQGIQAEGFDYRGVIYIGLMVTDKGSKVIEYNARFGDPEIEALMLRLNSDLLDIVSAIERKTLSSLSIDWKPDPAVCVVITSGGYPGAYEQGHTITMSSPQNNAVVFHSGTSLENGILRTAGGRVFMVCATGKTMEQSRISAYENVKKIQFEKCAYRKDIGLWN